MLSLDGIDKLGGEVGAGGWGGGGAISGAMPRVSLVHKQLVSGDVVRGWL